ncbi:DNA ligase [Paenibacillus thiaminolyticus]|uniref:DNA ligase n=3 Tax=Paenibacillus thiaminolyticus TaxID=49283 RepID=A0AAP9DYS6_PANTH|nr:DNA ligase [Paenibacillus thiaminolyticus]MCY9633453.1 DNA ligase [Paenibacillus thiaminolyticus]QDM46751.1 DNA ligase [Paenibacillus thiaminolyticus]CAH8710044.1 DNA ligase [Paenibacillus thiaminolyticus]SUA95324.1 DNA ligase 1 [Paenibacillus thiaminolyticus]
MNISQMVRGLVGEARPGEQRTLELKSGQVVRGTVASVAENGREAVIQINGVPVRAVLDAPMRPGQTAWLQVQGQQADGMIMLKAADGPAFTQLPSIEEALKQSGLPDEGWARRLLHELQKGGVPLTKDLASRLAQALAAKPQGVPAEQWMQAAGLALRRQLPLSGETLRGLQQAMFGKPLNDLLAGFQRAGEAALARSAGGPAGGAAPWAVPLREAQALVRDILASLPRMDSVSGGAPSSQAPAPAVAGGNLTATAAASTAGQPATGGSPAGNAAANAGSGPAAGTAATGAPLAAPAAAGPTAPTAATAGEGGAAAGAAGQTSAAGGGAWIGRLLQLLGVPHEQQLHRAAVLEMTAAGSGAPQGDGVPGGGASAESTAVRPQPGQAAPPAAGVAAQAPAMPGTPGPPEAAARPQAPQVPAPGGTQEQAPAAETAGAAVRAAAATAPEAAQAPPQQSAAQTTAAPAESLKSALLQLLQSEALPPAVREAAQQLVHQITGQQLLLTSDRQAPFTHVTLFVPLVTPDGQQTAAVHIQSRQSRRGELESDNCRLWFDLNMKALGRTLVDVQVVERAVALHIHQADEGIGEWMGEFRGEVEEAMNRIGYQLSAFRILPMPDTKVDEPKNRPEIDMDDYALQPYKGVDIKV